MSKRITISTDTPAEVRYKKLETSIRIPFWTRVKMLFHRWVDVCVSVKTEPVSLPVGHWSEATLFKVVTPRPVKLTAEIILTPNLLQWAGPNELDRIVEQELMKKLSTGIAQCMKVDRYYDYRIDSEIVRGTVCIANIKENEE